VEAAAQPVLLEQRFRVRDDTAGAFDAWLGSQLQVLAAHHGVTRSELLSRTHDGWCERTVLLHFDSPVAADAFRSQREPLMHGAAVALFGAAMAHSEPARPVTMQSHERDTPQAAEHRCENCGTPIRGAYCANCGQRDGVQVRSIWGFTRDATAAMLESDSRFWRTLRALLLRPGHLTREFLQGRRAAYLPPFRLYIVVSIGFFLLVQAAPQSVLIGGGQDGGAIVFSTDADSPEARERVAQLERAVEELETQIASETSSVRRTVLEQALRSAEAARDRARSEPDASAVAQDRESRLCSVDYNGPGQDWIEPRLQAGCLKAVADDGRQLVQSFMQNVPRAMFVFLPLLGFVMKALYWRPRRYYVEHLLFLVHNHAFVFLVFGTSLAAKPLLPAGAVASLLDTALFAYLTWYLYASLRRVYGQSRALTFAKFLVLGLTYFALGTTMVVMTMLFSVATL
jgi:hypothetical protein